MCVQFCVKCVLCTVKALDCSHAKVEISLFSHFYNRSSKSNDSELID